jgi:hypothetical protein
MLILLLSLTAVCLTVMVVGTPTIKGITTVAWGTQGILGSPAGAIVESIAITPKNEGPIAEIENGDGASVADVLLDDGFDAKVQCVHDRSKVWPMIGAAVTLTLPSLTDAGTTAYVCYVTGVPPRNKQRKKETTITLSLRYRPGIVP